MTTWSVWIVLTLLVTYIITETMGSTLREGFAVPRRSDIGPTTEGWSADEAGYTRDLRYTESFVDVQGNGVAADFCRAVYKNGDPASLHIACALATREGMDTLEFRSRTKAQGFRFSRDDYWRDVTGNGRMDYCRILKDQESGEWVSSCALTTRESIGPLQATNKTTIGKEIRDPSPPAAIQQLLRAYQGILSWYRWRDDAVDYAGNTQVELRGHPTVPEMLRPTKTRGLQLNRWPSASQDAAEAAPAVEDYLLWGEKQTMHLDQDVNPSQIRAISFWIWWDHFENGARVLECSNGQKKDLVWIGVDSYAGSKGLKPIPEAAPAQEFSPQQIFSLGPPLAEPVKIPAQTAQPEPVPTTTATLAMEIWDTEQRVMRIEAPQGAKVNEWQHVVFTTTDSTDWWPTWQIWINGQKVQEKSEGRMIPALFLTQNKIGKHVRGCLQDFRVYNRAMTERDIQEAIVWSSPILHPLP